MAQDDRHAAVTDEMLDDFFAQAIASHQAEDWQAAEDFYRKILAVIPEQANVNYNLGMLKLQCHQAHESLDYFKNALASDASEAKYWVSYIETLIQTGQKKQAAAVLTAGLEQGLYGDEVNALVKQFTQSVVTPPVAASAKSQTPLVINATPNVESPPKKTQSTASIQTYLNNPRVNKVVSLQQAGKLKQAKKQGTALLNQFPNHPVLLTCLAGIALSEGLLNESVALLEQSLSIVADQTTALSYLCIAYTQLNKLDLAIVYADKVLARDARHQTTWFNRGVVHTALKQFEAACEDFEQAVQLNPRHREAYHNLGNMYRKTGQFDKALVAYDAAIKLEQANPDSHNDKALLLGDMRRFDEAFASFQQAIAIDPSYDKAYWNQAFLHLRLGDFSQGWQQYESRWNASIQTGFREMAKPLWLGEESLQGKTLFIYPEQGFGDYIQFSRYVLEVEKLGAHVVLEVEKPLLALMQTLKSQCNIIEAGSALPDFDYHCPIMSLPLAMKTQLETIPANIPYLYANKDKVTQLSQQLDNKTQASIGLVWSGSNTHDNDYHRSLTLSMLKPLLALPVDFHVLQNEIRSIDRQVLAEIEGLQCHEKVLKDFSDTAALVANMDLVITVDTSVAHLAGAMGKDCWLLLPYSGDFRWFVDRLDSPWYPSMTLFRQEKPLDWTSVIERVIVHLQERFDLM